jgi:hypothetical protein
MLTIQFHTQQEKLYSNVMASVRISHKSKSINGLSNKKTALIVEMALVQGFLENIPFRVQQISYMLLDYYFESKTLRNLCLILSKIN